MANHPSSPWPGVLLIAAAAAALILDNSPLAPWYDQLLMTHLEIRVGTAVLDKPLLLWINDGLMAIFFLLIGLELKRELLIGEMRSLSKVALPLAGAVGGIIGPALLFWLINRHQADTLRGWAIPTATDIAFVLGVLALLGPHIPGTLRTFLVTLAVFDDVSAIIIIAAFYTDEISWTAKGLGLIALAILVAMNRLGVKRIGPYMMVGAVLWVCVLKSGVHATLAGVILGLCIPLRSDDYDSPLLRLEAALTPYVAWLILPVFAFANAGVSLAGISLASLMEPLTLGCAAGLLVGKLCGVLLATTLATSLGLAHRPAELSHRHLLGAALLAGVGFTMALFIGGLAFEGDHHMRSVRIGVLLASLVAAVSGYAVLRTTR